MRSGLALAGLLGGLAWVAVQAFPPEDEVVRNRVWSVALLGMSLGLYGQYTSLRPALRKAGAVGYAVMLVGLVLVTLGSFVEYWILFQLPHQGGPASVARSLPWMGFLIGAFLLFGASMIVGASMLHTHVAPRWVGLMFLTLLPLTVALAFVGPVLAALPIGCLSAAGVVARTERGR